MNATTHSRSSDPIEPGPAPLRVGIVGAGAIGGWLAAAFARAGCQVSALARGATLEALRRQGLILRSGSHQESHRLACSDRAAELGAQDLVVIAVKAPALAAVADSVGPLIHAETTILSAMNGVPWWFLHGFGGRFADRRLESTDPGGAIALRLGASQVVGGVVHASCSLDAPGEVRHGFGKRIILGDASPEGSTARASVIAPLLERAGIEANVSPSIQRDIWYKLWGNMTMNPVSAITGADSHQILDDPLVREFCSRVMMEAKSIGERLGIPIAQEPQDRHAVTRQLGAFRTSMLQDVQAGRPVELDALVASVQELGRITDVATPFTDALLGLTRLHARVRGLYA
jgi:2-dehydropantoate 2-reductase